MLAHTRPQVLDSIPDLDMLAYLPSLLDGLMGMLADPNREIRAQAHKALLEFLVEIQATPHVDFAALGAIQVRLGGRGSVWAGWRVVLWPAPPLHVDFAALGAIQVRFHGRGSVGAR